MCVDALIFFKKHTIEITFYKFGANPVYPSDELVLLTLLLSTLRFLCGGLDLG